ncbi:MAG: PAS domain S-box protein [Chloroflexi bacterium]|nr:PAS domain S-box protein [Chloroflexota bacterium]
MAARPQQAAVSPRKQVEASTIEAAQTNFKELLEAAPDPVIIVDQGHIVLANREAEKKFGYTANELLGHSIELLLPERFRAGHVGQREKYERNPHTRPMGSGLELFARRKDGTEFPVEISLSPSTSDGRPVVISIIRDISQRKRLEQQQDLLLRTVNHILDGMTEPVVVIDPAGLITRINEAVVHLLNKPRSAILGHKAHEVLRWEDEAGRLLDEDEYGYMASFSSGDPVTANRYLRQEDGKRIPVVVSSALVTDAARNSRMSVQVIRDVTREREAEELKDRIISLVSHELRTPIGHIKGFASSLLETDVQWDAATERDFITEIDREADRLAALVTDLLDMSKIESGKPFLEPHWHSPGAVVRQAVRRAESLLADHVLVADVPEDLPELYADPAQLERVVGNLIENAAKYTDTGTEIRVHVSATADAVEFCVSDRGAGIAPENRERIFERFFRVRGSTTPKPGTGLGLPICRGIVEAHGGTLWYEDNPGGGSCFQFRIPLAGAQEQLAPA